jgi:hypothetical protein
MVYQSADFAHVDLEGAPRFQASTQVTDGSGGDSDAGVVLYAADRDAALSPARRNVLYAEHAIHASSVRSVRSGPSSTSPRARIPYELADIRW